ncbi:alpha/beta hydrolase [Paracoccus ravus]|uniref:alpha/beta hydrolase n=1 Tax=Paracoccus ravus TaxID=2447760 RepID=UPI00106ECAE5|nr:alpha/beta-hydrolase family protein [Paracoccus ravus]
MFSILPLLAGLLMAAASLTPSLIPRDWIMQGVLAGLSMAVGYLVTVFLLALWRALQIPLMPRRIATVVHAVLAIPVLATLVRCVALSDDWQNSIRERMEMPLLEATSTTKTILLAAVVFLGLFVLGRGMQGLFNLLRNRLARYIPAASANVLGLLLAALIVVTVTRDGVVNWALRVADRSYAAAQHLTDPNTPPPDEPWRAGSTASLIDWDLMGKPGRDFVRNGPSAAAISAFTGAPAKEPLRIYVGLAQDKRPEIRAQIALDEMIRVGAFDRKVLVVASPTGTGWMDEASYDALEYMHGGDVATVGVQYSYLQSPLALIFETDAGLVQSNATMQAIYDHWRKLPETQRPRLYLHGISLGAWSSMYAMNPFQMMNQPVSGAFWVGPPFPSELWRQANGARQPSSPYILPEVDEGEVIRYASQFAAPDRSGAAWGRLRILFLQHASDPIVFYNPASLWRAPVWMHEPPAPDVSPRLSFTPIVTQLQLAVDMLVSTSTPSGYGHIYDAEEYIDGWIAVSAPEGWSPEHTARLKAKCGKDGRVGCDNRGG